jgi:hypothetical protein
LALIAWAPILAFRKPLGILIFAALFAAGAELLRRQTLVEFPNTDGSDLSRHWRSISAGLLGRRSRNGAAPSGDDQLARLERLSVLRREGALTDAEFEAQKLKLL